MFQAYFIIKMIFGVSACVLLSFMKFNDSKKKEKAIQNESTIKGEDN